MSTIEEKPWQEVLYEHLEDLKYAGVRDDWGIEEQMETLEQSEVDVAKAAWNEAVRRSMEVIEEVFRQHVKNEIPEVEEMIEEARQNLQEAHESEEYSEEEIEELHDELDRLERRLRPKKRQMEIIEELHEGG